MRILLDVGHPGHVHYFRNAARLLMERGHEVLFTARDRDVIFRLMDAYGLPYVSRGRGGRGLLGKLLYLFRGDWTVARVAAGFRPDLFMSFGSPYAAQASKLLGKPHLAFDDTEHARYEHAMYVPFTETIVTPRAYRKDFGGKHLRFEGSIELCHLAPAYFRPDARVLADVGLTEHDPFVLLRFVSWDASHDRGQSGISYGQKLDLVERLRPHARVLISSEAPLPAELEPYRLRLAPEKLHDLMAFASLYVGEGATTANECAFLGVPNLLISSLLGPETCPGVFEDFKKWQLQEHFVTFAGVPERALELLRPGVRQRWQQRRDAALPQLTDVTALTVWLVEQYPLSAERLRRDPQLLRQFRIGAEVSAE